jgi:4-diphosphocytidyl-2-C-methyl-D-erythritol kinase
MTDRVAIRAHAKANLFLRVLAREASGFHTLETLFTLLELHDLLTVERTEHGIELLVTGADTGPVEENLAYRAARMVLDATGHRFGVRMHLEKRIPVQAGLGGGSSDGAAALHAVNALLQHEVPRPELLQFAAKLGSDVPFLASGAPLALAWGRGERLMRLPPPSPAPTLLALPDIQVSTKGAYALLDAWQASETPRGSVVLDRKAFDTWGSIGRLGGNDFENPIFGREPTLRALFEEMAETRPLLARLSGSGAAVVAVFKNEADRDAAALTISGKDRILIRTSTRQAPAPGADRGVSEHG